MDIYQFLSEKKGDIRLLTKEEFKDKHNRYQFYFKKEIFDRGFEMYATHTWLDYSAEIVMYPNFHKLGDYAEKFAIGDKRAFVPKQSRLNYGEVNDCPVIVRKFLEFPEFTELVKDWNFLLFLKEEISLGVSNRNITNLEFIPWNEKYGLLVANTDVCAQGWVGFVRKDSIIEELKKALAQYEEKTNMEKST